jgi:predicted dehydrogenase
MTTYRAVAIGHTGRGDYGHAIDLSAADLPQVELVALADPDEAGRVAARRRTGTPRAYADYRAMLDRERPELALICPRWCDQHLAMILACVEAGVRGIYCEKPLTPTLADADAALAACRRAGVALTVAHRSRENPYVHWARDLLASGELGRIEALRAHGKFDHRHGGMDLAVLAGHLFDQMRYLAGAPAWVFGTVTAAGRPVTRADARPGAEGVGLIAGDRIAAMFGFPDGVVGYYESYPGDRAGERWYGVEVHCTRGILALRNLPRGEVYRYPHGLWLPLAAEGAWERVLLPDWESGADGAPRAGRDWMSASNRRHLLSLIAALESGGEPRNTTTAAEAVAVQEMLTGIYAAHLAGARLPLPLAARGDPLATR